MEQKRTLVKLLTSSSGANKQTNPPRHRTAGTSSPRDSKPALRLQGTGAPLGHGTAVGADCWGRVWCRAGVLVSGNPWKRQRRPPSTSKARQGLASGAIWDRCDRVPHPGGPAHDLGSLLCCEWCPSLVFWPVPETPFPLPTLLGRDRSKSVVLGWREEEPGPCMLWELQGSWHGAQGLPPSPHHGRD